MRGIFTICCLARKRALRISLWSCLLSGFAPAFAGAASAAGETSVYTTLDLERDCVTISTYEAGGTFACTGHKGYPVLLSEGDLRQSVFFGHVGPWFQTADGGQAFASFGMFNSIGSTIEWRLDAQGVPFAAILRWTIEPQDGGTAKDSVLVISRVGQPGEAIACVAGYVDAAVNPDANELARKAADNNARDFACFEAEAVWHGKSRETGPAPSVYYPAAQEP
jgi:hypothetical protein